MLERFYETTTKRLENVRSAMSEEWLMLQHFSNPHHPHFEWKMKSSLWFSMTFVENFDFVDFQDFRSGRALVTRFVNHL